MNFKSFFVNGKPPIIFQNAQTSNSSVGVSLVSKMKISTTIISLLSCFLAKSQVSSQTVAERSNALSLLLANIQCFPRAENGDTDAQIIPGINQSFDPNEHLDEYTNQTDIELLLHYVKKSNHSRDDDPFTNSPEHISQLSLILNVLYHNSENWPLFYNTSAWLLDRVNSAQLFWALMVVSGEKLSDKITVPSAVEVFPQLFVPKTDVLSAAGLTSKDENVYPLQYWTGDPGLNEFHTHWHMDQPFWWDEKEYGVIRYRKGELFMYMHHQIVCRFNAELLGNGLPETSALELDDDYQIPEGYTPDIVNINYDQFPSRKKGERMGYYDSGKSLDLLKTWFDRLSQGIEQRYFQGPNNTRVSLEGDNATDTLGSTVESSVIHSANLEYYGSFHNYLHREIAGMSRNDTPIPGVEAHSETAMRDPVFYRLHTKVDSLFIQLKSHAPPYTKNDLDFPGVIIKSVDIQTPRHRDEGSSHWPSKPSRRPHTIRWPFPGQTPTLTTYFTKETYDISTAARPCRSINDEPTYVRVKTLTHVPFKYNIVLHSSRNQVAYGMVRIFMWPEFTLDGRKLEGDEAHQRAIEMDRFRVQIEPSRDTVITRSSIQSSLTRLEPPPGIKALHKAKGGSNLLRPEMRRACGFPNNLLVPKGNKEGVKYKMTVHVSDETEMGWVNEYPNYPLCGSLNGIHYPDRRPMGFPFDRPGTKFVTNQGLWPVTSPTPMRNVKEIRVLVKHQDSK